MKRIRYYCMAFLAIFFPYIALLLSDNPGGALMALLMVVTLVGWIPASIWALRVVRRQWKASTAEETPPTETPA